MRPTASPLVTFGIATIAVAVALLAALFYARAGGRDGRGRRFAIALVAIGAWMALLLALAARGLLSRFDARPPPIVVVMFATVALGAYVGLSRVGARLADNLPLAWLVGLQAFRLPLELVMHRAATEGVMPVQMSFSGWNFDIVTGLLAAIIAPVLARRPSRVLAMAWNVIGLALLANIATIAVVSTPLIAAFGREPARLNTWVAYPPFIWMAVLVSAALAGHLIVARKLAAPKRA